MSVLEEGTSAEHGMMNDRSVMRNLGDAPWRKPIPDYLASMESAKFGLLVVDMTYYSAHSGFGACARYKREGYTRAIQYYVDSLRIVTRQVADLAKMAREAGGQVIFTRVLSITGDGRDMNVHQRHLGIHVAPGSKESQILDDVGSTEEDIVVSKQGWSSFYGTNLDSTLRSLGIETLVVCGVTTDGCVEATVREAADRGYKLVLVEDACTTSSLASHRATLMAVGSRHTLVTDTRRVKEKLSNLAAAAHVR